MLKYEYMPNQEHNYIKRELFEEVVDHLDKKEMTLITGSRQVGKTVLLEQLKEYLSEQKNISLNSIFSYNLDLVQDWEVFQDQTEFIKFLKARSEHKIYVFVDEAQKVPEAARFFKGVYDSQLNIKLVLTGSSSLEIKAKFKETLSGRKRIFSLPAFTFFEFLQYQDKVLAEQLAQAKEINQIDQKQLIKFYKDYLIFGGYPRVITTANPEEKINVLKEIYSSYIERDIVGFLEIKNKSAFNRLIKLLAGQLGQLVNIDELAASLSIDRETVERYIFALEQTFIIKRLTPYFKNSRQEIIKANKIYFLDNGIRNLALENFASLEQRIDKGPLLENAIFSELLLCQRNKMGQLHFWRTKQKTEIDFVVEEGCELLPIEVKFALAKEKVTTSFNNFITKFNPSRALVVNLSISQKHLVKDKTVVDFIYPFEIRKFLV